MTPDISKPRLERPVRDGVSYDPELERAAGAPAGALAEADGAKPPARANERSA